MQKQIISHVLVGVGSAALGTGVTYVILKKRIQQLADEEIASVKAAYQKAEPVVEPAAEHLQKLQEERAEVEKEIQEYTEDIEDLGYKQVTDADMVDNTPEGAEPLKVENRVKRYLVTDQVIPAAIEEPSATRPYIIREEQYHDEYQHFEKHSITFFEEDDTLAMPDDRPVEDVDAMVGDALTRFGEGSNDKDIVYVRNQVQRTDYEIIRNKNSFGVMVLGFDKETTPKVRKMRDHE